jgi:hypothetical protein
VDLQAAGPAYTETEVERSTTWVFHAGQPVYELIASVAAAWVGG